MASDEDLIREATALRQRIEVSLEGQAEKWVWGRRANGCVSAFCGSLVIQFNSANELRRAFADGHRVKAEQGRLIRLERPARGGSVRFSETPLNDEEQTNLLKAAANALQEMADALESIETTNASMNNAPLRASGDCRELCSVAKKWVKAMLASPLVVADQPHAT